MKTTETCEYKDLNELCQSVRTLLWDGEFEKGTMMVCKAMCMYPHSPEPHNLMGLLLERTGDHVTAMKHYRVAWDLDPSYRPARQNMTRCGNLAPEKYAFDESDCEDSTPVKRHKTILKEN